MNSFSILTLGCKVNQYESQQIRELLERFGLASVEVAAHPDLVVVNTCCVTRTASAKSRRAVRQARRHEPQAVVICGCLPAVATGELGAVGENVYTVENRRDLPAVLSVLVSPPTTPDSKSPKQASNTVIRARNEPKVKYKKDLAPPPELPQLTAFQGHTRAFLKIQDGCDAFCTYCIIPKARPKVHSKTPDKVLAEAASLVAAGHKEIVLTGVHIGAYGRPTVRRRRGPDAGNAHLPDLLDRIARVPGLARVRLGSLDPADVTPRLLDVLVAHRNIMPHLHLSLQSGSDNVLRRMCRPYRADDFRAKIELIASRLDRPAITTDMIVGFPGEEEADFQQSIALAKETGFAKIHVFAFSPRRGTAAATMQGRVPSQVVKERSHILRDLDEDLQYRFRGQFVGETAQVLIETTNGHPAGRAERYFMVRVADRSYRSDWSNGTYRTYNNDLIRVTIVENTRDSAVAAPI